MTKHSYRKGGAALCLPTERPDRAGPRYSDDYEELLVIATEAPASRGRLHEIDETLVFTRLLQGRVAESLHAGLERACPAAYAARRCMVPGKTPTERRRQIEAFVVSYRRTRGLPPLDLQMALQGPSVPALPTCSP